MIAPEWALLVLVTIPLWVVVAWTAIHVARRPDLRPTTRLAWLVAVLLFPALGAAAYLVVRPVPLPVETRERRGGTGAELATLVDRLDAGEIDRPAFEAAVERLLAPLLGA